MLNVGFLWLAVSIGSEITGTSFIKKTNSFTNFGMSVLVISAYSLCYYCLSQTMAYLDIGVAYSLWCGFGIVGVTILSMLLYKQKPDLPAIIAMICIITGAVLMNIVA